MLWKAIKGFQGYQVSNTGLVRSLKHKQPIIMKQTETPKGYMRINLNKHGNNILFVHRLVASAFIPNPDNLETVNHIDGNKKNNCVWNLEWLSVGDNIRHYKNNNKLKISLSVRQNHDKMIKAKGTKEVKNITTGEVFSSVKEAAKKYKINEHIIVVAIYRGSKCADCLWKYTGKYKNRAVKLLRPISKKMRSRVKEWRKTAQESCTVNGVLRCALCGYAITGEWHAHHYKERRGVSHSVDNDKYVAALHPGCHLGIDHNSTEAFNFARDRIEQNLNLWRKK